MGQVAYTSSVAFPVPDGPHAAAAAAAAAAAEPSGPSAGVGLTNCSACKRRQARPIKLRGFPAVQAKIEAAEAGGAPPGLVASARATMQRLLVKEVRRPGTGEHLS